jgi:hypothetical protein
MTQKGCRAVIALTPEETKEWPARRWQVVRYQATTVLWKGPLLGLILNLFIVGGTAGLLHFFGGETLDFGWFQIPGQAGAPVFPVLYHFWVYAVWTIPMGTAFLALVGTAVVVTLELSYRRRN